MGKLIAIKSGSDWADASVNYVMITVEGMTTGQLNVGYKEAEHKGWVDKEGRRRWLSFDDWLIEMGYGRKPTNDELEEFWDE